MLGFWIAVQRGKLAIVSRAMRSVEVTIIIEFELRRWSHVGIIGRHRS